MELFPKSCWYFRQLSCSFGIFHEINNHQHQETIQLETLRFFRRSAQLICRASLLPVDDGEVLGPKVGCLAMGCVHLGVSMAMEVPQ